MTRRPSSFIGAGPFSPPPFQRTRLVRQALEWCVGGGVDRRIPGASHWHTFCYPLTGVRLR
jgi:hypothetical protein